jgi:hypothetical protein
VDIIIRIPTTARPPIKSVLLLTAGVDETAAAVCASEDAEGV